MHVCRRYRHTNDSVRVQKLVVNNFQRLVIISILAELCMCSAPNTTNPTLPPLLLLVEKNNAKLSILDVLKVNAQLWSETACSGYFVKCHFSLKSSN